MARDGGGGLGLLLGLGVVGVGVYFYGQSAGWFGVPATTAAPAAAAPPTPAPAVAAPTAPAPVLTAADAATFPYSGSVTDAQMNAISATLQGQIATGQIPLIAGNSVLAYMLGWGGAQLGAQQTAKGETYQFDGTNWNLIPAPIAAAAPPAGQPGQLSALALKVLTAAGGKGPQDATAANFNVNQWNYYWAVTSGTPAPSQTLEADASKLISFNQYLADRTSAGLGISGYRGLGARPRTMWGAKRINYQRRVA